MELKYLLLESRGDFAGGEKRVSGESEGASRFEVCWLVDVLSLLRTTRRGKLCAETDRNCFHFAAEEEEQEACC